MIIQDSGNYIKYMKHIIILIGTVLLIIGCVRNNYDYKLENDILECFYQHHEDKNINVKSSIDKIENTLIKHNILTDKTGESYIDIIKQIRDKDEFEISDSNLIAEIESIKYIPPGVKCYDTTYIKYDSVELANSKFKNIIGIFEAIQSHGDFSPKLIAEEILKVFDESDFVTSLQD